MYIDTYISIHSAYLKVGVSCKTGDLSSYVIIFQRHAVSISGRDGVIARDVIVVVIVGKVEQQVVRA